jgi:para-nitrobenzyl esterase
MRYMLTQPTRASLCPAYGLALTVFLALSTSATSQAEESPIVAVPQGAVRGSQSDGVSRYLGIPYAAAPTGFNRWAEPKAAPHWGTEVRQTITFGPSCPQTLHTEPMMAWTSEYLTPTEPGVNEDCLSLNIWAPADGQATEAREKQYPVLVFVHGGGFTEGGSAVPIYDGANLAKRGVVVVTLNYRIGTLGFLAHPLLSKEQNGGSGNYGFQDQIAALSWVNRNIEKFGGDAARVTLAGQSAGAWSVMTLLASPNAVGLFRAAIVMSVPDLKAYTPLDQAEVRGTEIFKTLNVSSLTEARSLPASSLIGGTAYGNMTIDGKVLPTNASPENLAMDVPILMGYTLNDLFAPTPKHTVESWRLEAQQRYGANAGQFLRFYPGLTDAQASESAAREAGDRFLYAPITTWLSRRNATSPVYVYRFSHVEPGVSSGEYGAFHTSELPYMFDTLHVSPERPFTEVDRTVVEQFSGAIEAFVKVGDPNGGNIPHWPPMTTHGKQVMEFGKSAVLSRSLPDGAENVIAQGKPPRRPTME